MEFIEQLLEGDRRAAARLISMIESREDGVAEVLSSIHPHTGKAMVVGITGPPGTGKSTLVSKMTQEFRDRGKSVGILAVDPTSPFTGGALLGDRIRMQDVALDKEVFIRSMGTRGNLGGLSWATGDAIRVLDAMGKDIVIVETVGAGQAEVDIVELAHTSLVIVMPGLGDDIQTIKAGLMEIGNIFVVNKGDLAGAEKRRLEVQSMLQLGEHKDWMPPVILAVARDGKGIPEIVESIEKHWEYLSERGLLKAMERKRYRTELFEILEQRIHFMVHDRLSEEELEGIIEQMVKRELDPYKAAERVMLHLGLEK